MWEGNESIRKSFAKARLFLADSDSLYWATKNSSMALHDLSAEGDPSKGLPKLYL